MHIRFDRADVKLETYFNQVGSGGSYFQGYPPYQRGYGYYHGMFPRQRGYGFGDIFRRLMRFLKPIASAMAPVAASAGKAIGEEGLATTARVLNNMVQGANIKEAIASEGREDVRNLLARAEKKLASQTGSGRKGRKWRKNNRKVSGVTFMPNNAIVGSLVPAKAIKRKRQRADAFGPY